MQKPDFLNWDYEDRLAYLIRVVNAEEQERIEMLTYARQRWAALLSGVTHDQQAQLAGTLYQLGKMYGVEIDVLPPLVITPLAARIDDTQA